jgi:hypothetical protein
VQYAADGAMADADDVAGIADRVIEDTLGGTVVALYRKNNCCLADRETTK